MGATFGKNLDTGMSHIKFGSTGRTVEFTPEESVDFEAFLKGVEVTGRMKEQVQKELDNPFHLFKTDVAIGVTIAVKLIISELAQDIIDLEITSEYPNLLVKAADRIKRFYNTKVGLSDTASREAMGVYLQTKLVKVFDAVDHIQMMQDFMNHL